MLIQLIPAVLTMGMLNAQKSIYSECKKAILVVVCILCIHRTQYRLEHAKDPEDFTITQKVPTRAVCLI